MRKKLQIISRRIDRTKAGKNDARNLEVISSLMLAAVPGGVIGFGPRARQWPVQGMPGKTMCRREAVNFGAENRRRMASAAVSAMRQCGLEKFQWH
ncbi:hypothetical protein VOM14_28555 [Paraburkholderia sp. MPAMCS5]|uniref:hypothetical protein n=1 Tax=Paraburkholderia sp. MPAMCS5 TaxID=3112563 RepID=UPI002E17D011|nr:hypothetical protein [Paraburkholderia sp. MPAMCS5]